MAALAGVLSCRPASEGVDSPDPPAPKEPRRAPSKAALRAFADGESLINRSEYRAAAEKFREAVDLDPDFAQAWYRLAWATGRGTAPTRRPSWRCGEAILQGEALPQAQRDIFQATAFFLEGQYSEGIPLAEALLVDDPENKEALYILSEMYLHSAVHADVGQANEAMLILERLDPSFSLIRDHLVLGLTMQGRWPEAAAHVERWMADDPQMVELRYLGLAMANQVQGGAGAARSPHPCTRQLSDGDAPYHGPVGAGAAAGGRRSGRRLRALLAAAVPGRCPRLLRRIRSGSRSLSRSGRDRRLAAAQTASPSVAWLALAELHLLNGDTATAKVVGGEAVRLQPESPGAHYGAGRLALLDGDRDSAAEHLAVIRQAASRSHGTLADLFELALEAELLLADGQAEDAEAALREPGAFRDPAARFLHHRFELRRDDPRRSRSLPACTLGPER